MNDPQGEREGGKRKGSPSLASRLRVGVAGHNLDHAAQGNHGVPRPSYKDGLHLGWRPEG